MTNDNNTNNGDNAMTNELSKEMIKHAENVARLILEDNAGEAYIEADEETRSEFTVAYMEEWGRRIEKMQTIYMTNPEAAEAMNATVFELM